MRRSGPVGAWTNSGSTRAAKSAVVSVFQNALRPITKRFNVEFLAVASRPGDRASVTGRTGLENGLEAPKMTTSWPGLSTTCLDPGKLG